MVAARELSGLISDAAAPLSYPGARRCQDIAFTPVCVPDGFSTTVGPKALAIALSCPRSTVPNLSVCFFRLNPGNALSYAKCKLLISFYECALVQGLEGHSPSLSVALLYSSSIWCILGSDFGR